MSWSDYGCPIIRTDEVDEVLELMRKLYVDLRQSTGGPLHVQLDDWNYHDDCWTPKYLAGIYDHLRDPVQLERWNRGADVDAIIACCDRIIELMREMSEPERLSALAWHWGEVQKHIPTLEEWTPWQQVAD